MEGCYITTVEKQFLRLEDIGKCPFCGGGLLGGYLNAPEGLFWDTRKRGGFWAIGGGPIKLASRWQWALKNIPTLVCVKCNLIMMSGPPQGFLKKCRKCKSKIPFDSEECKFCGAHQQERK